MSALNTILAIDGQPDVLDYLADMGLELPEGFTSIHPSYSQVKIAMTQLSDWQLGEPDGERRFWCDVMHQRVCVTTLMFRTPDGAAEPVLAGTRGDLALPLLRELARRHGPLVVLVNSEDPLLVEAAP